MARITVKMSCANLDTGGYWSKEVVDEIVADHIDNMLRHLGVYNNFEMEVEYEEDEDDSIKLEEGGENK